jgi:hypothetical protein
MTLEAESTGLLNGFPYTLASWVSTPKTWKGVDDMCDPLSLMDEIEEEDGKPGHAMQSMQVKLQI